MAHLRSVNVGTPREASWAQQGRTAIEKTPVVGPAAVRLLGVEGDQVADTKDHGGREQAVYAFAREDLDAWAEALGAPIPDGGFGENLTTVGLDVNAAEVGEQWRIGSVLLEVRSVRTPCADFKAWMGRCGHDNTAWVKRFAAQKRPGPYLRVLEEGTLRAGEEIEVVHRPGHGVTVSTMFRALTGEPELLPQLQRVDDLTPRAQARLERHLANASG